MKFRVGPQIPGAASDLLMSMEGFSIAVQMRVGLKRTKTNSLDFWESFLSNYEVLRMQMEKKRQEKQRILSFCDPKSVKGGSVTVLTSAVGEVSK